MKSLPIIAMLAVSGAALAQTSYQSRGSATTTTVAEDGKGRSIAFSFGLFGGSYSGRSLKATDFRFDIKPHPSVSIWIGASNVDAKGRTDDTTGRRSSFEARATSYGIRYEFAAKDGRPAVGLSYAASRSSDGHQELADGTKATYYGPRSDALIADSMGYEFGIHRIKAGNRSATLIGAGYAMEKPVAKNLTGHVEGKLFYEKPSGTIVNPDASTRGMVRLGVSYDSPSWGSVGLYATVFPGGVPYGGTPIGGFSSFFLYEPGGVAEDLRTKTTGYLDLRVSLRANF
ncbi:MAG: hypothetical protein KIS66_14670 [Fimbriimonadaceae bacterium]|nr:hypothetical protein [Fimbriimonadaceae bacterium]